MNKINWENSPSTRTPLNADNLNRMQDNIEDAMEIKITTGQEFATNEYIDGKRVYGKYFNVGQLGTAGEQKTINHGLDLNQVTIISVSGTATRQDNQVTYPLPFVYSTNIDEFIGVWVSPNVISLVANAQRTDFHAKVLIKYTKNNE